MPYFSATIYNIDFPVPVQMPEIILLCVLMIPQIVAGILARSMGRNFWFWFFISFLMPIISLGVLLYLDRKNEKQERKGYKLAPHLRKDQCSEHSNL